MKIIAISYANERYKKAQQLNKQTAIKIGKVDDVITYGPNDIDHNFYNKYSYILDQKRGNGYWLWKPYFILKTLNKMQDGDYLCYCDSGVTYYAPVSDLVNTMIQNEQSIMCFEIGTIEKQYTKRDIFVYLDCDDAKYTDSHQRCATISLYKNCKESRSFVEEWLSAATYKQLITDAPNELGKDNYPDFIENRHDQSIWSLLTKKHNIPAFRNPDTPPEKIVIPSFKREVLIQGLLLFIETVI